MGVETHATYRDRKDVHNGRRREEHFVEGGPAPDLLSVQEDPYRNGVQDRERPEDQRLKEERDNLRTRSLRQEQDRGSKATNLSSGQGELVRGGHLLDVKRTMGPGGGELLARGRVLLSCLSTTCNRPSRETFM